MKGTTYMFENPGRKIKTLATILFVLEVMGSFACAVLFGKAPNYRGFMEYNALYIILILVGGIIISFISSLFLYTFGDIAENIQSIAKSKAPTAGSGKDTTATKNASGTKSTQTTTLPQTSAPSPVPTSYYINRAKTGIQDDAWVCQNCGFENDKSSRYCKKCGENKK